jgi:hypothetical protein
MISNSKSLITNHQSSLKTKKPAGTSLVGGPADVRVPGGSVHAIDQVTQASALHIQTIHTSAQARGTGRIWPKTGEEPENIRKIIP